MKRLYFAVGLLIISIALCAAEQRFVAKVNTVSNEIISQALDAVDKNDRSEVQSACRKLSDFWQDNYGFMSAMVDHNCFDDASQSIDKIEYMAQSNDKELKATLLELKGQIEKIEEDERLTLGNIF